MTPAEINLSLLRANVSASGLARQVGVPRQSISAVINGHACTPYLRRAVAVAINRSYLEVWGAEDPGVDRLRVLPGLPPVSPVVNTTHHNGEAV